MKTNTFLRYIILIGIFVIPFVPLVVSSGIFFPFITGKNFSFRVLTEIVFAAWLILALRDSLYRPKLSYIFYALVAFVAVVGLADLFAVNPIKAFWSNFERMEGYISILHLFAYFLVIGTVLDKELLWKRFFQTSIGVSVFVGFYGVLQLLGKAHINQGGVRIDSTLGNASYLALYMFLHSFITLFLLLRERTSKTLQWIYGIIIFFQLFIVYHTATRGTIIGLLAGAFVMLVLTALFEKERLFLRKAARFGILGLIIIVGGFLLIKESDFVKSDEVLGRFASISFNELRARTYIWNMAWHGFLERPILGWGQEGFNYVFNKYYDPRMYSQEQWFDRAHDTFLDWLTAAGILGLISYLSLYAFLILYLWAEVILPRAPPAVRPFLNRFINSPAPRLSVGERNVLTGLLAGYFFNSLFIFDNITSYIFFFSLLAFVHFMHGRNLPESLESKIPTDRGLIERIITPAVVVALVFALYYGNIRNIIVGSTLIEAIRGHEEGAAENLRYFEKALSYESMGDPEIREQLTQFAGSAFGQDIDLALKQEILSLARAELLKQVEKTPRDARYELFLGSYLNTIRRFDEALPHLERALELTPRKQTAYFELGSNLLNQRKFAEALEVFKQAHELEPRFDLARKYYAFSAIYNKRDDIVEEVLTPIYDDSVPTDDLFVRAYVDTGRPDKVLLIWQKRIKIEPNNPQNFISLAAAHLQLNQRAKAVEALRRAIELKPDFKEQGEFYIREIQAGRNP